AAQLPYEVVAVRVGTERIGTADADVDLRAFTEERAQAELRSSQAMAASGQATTAARWPGRGATVPRSNLLASTQPFIGRSGDLERLREGLDAAQVQLLTGPAGTGKSKLVREYIARYGHDYDLVWWLAADDPLAVRTGLGELGRALGAPSGGDPVAAALGALLSTSQGWLLTYRNAVDHAAIADLIPAGGRGHVVVTAPAGARRRWPEQRLGPLARAEAVDLLRGYVAELTDSAANTILRKTGTLPITLRLAGAYLAATVARRRQQQGEPVATAVERAAAQLVDGSRGETGGHPRGDPTASCLALLRADVIEETPRGRLALRLAEMCAFLPPDRIALRVLTSAGMLDQLAAAGGADGPLLAADPFELHQVLPLRAEDSLFAVHWGTGAPVRMHRLLPEP